MNRSFIRTCLLAWIVVGTAANLAAETKPKAKTIEGWNRYIALTEQRIQSQLNTPVAFVRTDVAHLKSGNIYIDPMTTRDGRKEIDIDDGTIHHWLGAIYIPGKSLDYVLKWVQDYNSHQDYFKEVEASRLKAQSGDHFEIFLKLVRSKSFVTVRFNTDHTIDYVRNGTGRVSSRSVATHIAQLDSSGKEYPPGEDSGYLWRLNSYWRFSERDGGVVVECESIALSKSLGSFASFINLISFNSVKKMAEGIARDALNDMLDALKKGVSGGARKSRN